MSIKNNTILKKIIEWFVSICVCISIGIFSIILPIVIFFIVLKEIKNGDLH